MPRKGKIKAISQVEASQRAFWRYRLRNPKFQKDMNDLCQIFRTQNIPPEDRMKKCEKVAETWGLLRIPLEAIVYWPGFPLAGEDFREMESYAATPGTFYSPVAATERRDERFLNLRVDLQHPVDDLLPLIEAELRDQIGNRPPKRRHLNKVDFHLAVFDLACEGLTFASIADELGRRPSSVRSAYFAAAQRVLGPADMPEKRHLPLDYFDPTTHAKTCSTCKNAKAVEEMCPETQRFIRQDHVAQRELPGYDTTRG